MRRDARCFYKRIQKLRSLISYSALPLYIKVPTNRMEILVTGTSGVGKSTLVNALVGKRVANTGDQLLRDGSEYVKSYEGTSEGGVEIVVWDSPGLEDGQGKDNQYLNELKKKCGNVDVVIYCVDLSATRSYGLSAAEVAPNDLSAVKKLTATFGSNWWKRSVFAMTRANVLESALKVKPDVDKRFNGRLQEWKERIHATLIATGVPQEVAYTIPVEPVGHPRKPRLPARENWPSELWRQISVRRDDDDADFVYVTPPGEGRKNKGKKSEKTSPGVIAARVGIVAASVAGLGAVVGFVGGPVGAAVGGAAGGAVGFAAGLLVHASRARET